MAEITALPTVNHDKDGQRLENQVVEEKDKHYETQHVEMGEDEGIDAVKAEMHLEDANRAEDFEHEMGTWQAFKIYRAVSSTPQRDTCVRSKAKYIRGCLLVNCGINVDYYGRVRLGTPGQLMGYD